jgi:hypothetical protein
MTPNDSTPTPDAGSTRSSALVLGGFRLYTDTVEKGVSWEVNRKIYEAWRIFDPWPRGMLLHMAGPDGPDVRVEAVWTDSHAEAEHMGTVGIERFTKVVEVLAREFEGPPPDMLPVSLVLRHVSFGPLAKHFVDIGPDLDESSGKQLGTALTTLDLDCRGLTEQQTEELWRAAGLGETVPSELILRIVYVVDGALRETQLWKSESSARAFAEDVLTPEAERIAGTAQAISTDFREIKRLAISSDEFDATRF